MFETARLIVRHLLADDLDAHVAVYGDAEAMRWVGDGQPLTREQCENSSTPCAASNGAEASRPKPQPR